MKPFHKNPSLIFISFALILFLKLGTQARSSIIIIKRKKHDAIIMYSVKFLRILCDLKPPAENSASLNSSSSVTD